MLNDDFVIKLDLIQIPFSGSSQARCPMGLGVCLSHSIPTKSLSIIRCLGLLELTWLN